MTFTPQIIDNTTPGESLRSGADKINMNFAAIAQEFDVGVPDLIDSMFGSTFGHIETDILSINYIPVTYRPALTPSVSATDQLGAHLHGIDRSLEAIWTELSDDASEWAPISHGALNHSGTIGTEAQVTFDSTGGHDHDGTDSKTIDHTNLGSKGSNTHSQIDSFISSKASASGLASLSSGSLVVQNPANATATPTASKIPIADGSGKLDGWVSLSGKASTDHDATHITGGSDEIDGDKLDIDWNPANYTPTTVTNYADSVDNLTAHFKGIDDAIGGKSASNHNHDGSYSAIAHTHNYATLVAASFTQATSSPVTLLDPPNGTVITRIVVVVDSAASAGSPTVSVGTAGDADRDMDELDSDIKTAATYIVEPYTACGTGGDNIILTITPDSQTFSGRCYLHYAVPV